MAVFAAYVVCMADRFNIGAVLPFIGEEFHLDNFTIGAISSFFFLGYAVSQIPAGLLIGKQGTRAIASMAILAFSIRDLDRGLHHRRRHAAGAARCCSA
ncbi:MAG: MFS transporter [Micropruina sp.]